MTQIYFIGGAKGVGKTTLIKKIASEFSLPVINTGNFFSSKETPAIIKAKMIEEIINAAPIIADTHYAGHYKNRLWQFERGLTEKELNYLSSKTNIEFILIDLDTEEVQKRRLYDTNRIRDNTISNIRQELKANREYFNLYCQQLKKKGHIIYNKNIEESYEKIYKIMSEY